MNFFSLLPFTKADFFSAIICYFSSCPRMKSFGVDLIGLGERSILFPRGLFEV